MATIPGVFIIGGTNIQGGDAGNTPDSEITTAKIVAGFGGFQWWSRELFEIIPSGSTGEPNASTLSWWPWYDENLGTTYTVAGGGG